ncbi:MAG: hypothetical protein GW762_02860 [Candidatus Pacebacteria bacterium]|nr:hypothetical protein [Candidatus Paceibacterota bacterium]
MSKPKKKRDKKYSAKSAASTPGSNFLKTLGQFSQQRAQKNTRAVSIHIPRKPK